MSQQALRQQHSTSLSLPSGNYIYSLARCGGTSGDALAAISSDDSLRLFDRRTLQLQGGKGGGFANDIHKGGVTCLCDFGVGDKASKDGSSNNMLVTGGRDGRVKLWDVRGEGKPVVEFQTDKNAPVLSATCNAETNTVVAGTELMSSQAIVAFWDIRSAKQPRLQYSESHNDDVTELQFHPENSSILLSGSTDGLVNIYDTTISDEDDALLQVVNHGSVHHAGFLAENAIYALSHDEIFSIYPRHSSDEDATEPPPIPFGDLRPALSCNYVVQVLRNGSGQVYVAAGSTSEQRVDIVPLNPEPKWNFSQTGIWRLPGGHGEEVVRSIYLDEEANAVFTCGEDGFVRVWKMEGDAAVSPTSSTAAASTEAKPALGDTSSKSSHKKDKDKKHKEKRYKPY